MTTITLTTVENKFREVRSNRFSGLKTLVEILQKGLSQYRAEQTLETYLHQMRANDVVVATHQAKERSHAIIEFCRNEKTPGDCARGSA